LVAADVLLRQRASFEEPGECVQQARLAGAVGAHEHGHVVERHGQVLQAAKVRDLDAGYSHACSSLPRMRSLASLALILGYQRLCYRLRSLEAAGPAFYCSATAYSILCAKFS